MLEPRSSAHIHSLVPFFCTSFFFPFLNTQPIGAIASPTPVSSQPITYSHAIANSASPIDSSVRFARPCPARQSVSGPGLGWAARQKAPPPHNTSQDPLPTKLCTLQLFSSNSSLHIQLNKTSSSPSTHPLQTKVLRV
ncbi:hypothetical protein BKA61DRAFT_332364 [Leptodontidium sp. MPI-SDFR-AT-0119]|nr:hypothetical protein BKA61DRAFT_332364 [Leptodontidium sp. MPI-SDFR-AT-0119]